MKIGNVIGSIWATRKAQCLQGQTFLVVRTGEEELADAAIHFALMSYAAGVASSRYVTLLRQRQEAREEAASAAHAKSKERAKKEKEKD